jgi:N-acetyl-gamma-glutamyl-phosphate reductase common form
MIKVGVFGAADYRGGEALRVLLEHPHVEIAWATSNDNEPVGYRHRNLFESGVKLVKPHETTPCDTVLMALSAGKTMEMARALLDQNVKVIDLGADFRLKNRTDWEGLYGKTHSDWALAESAVYGMPELYRDQIKKSNLIANPGCHSSAAILGLAPLISNSIIDTEKIVVDGLSGSAVAGAEPELPIHHPELSNNLVPYNVVDHRHTYEIEQELGYLANSRVTVHLTTTFVPVTRGVLIIGHCFPLQKVSRKDLLDLYREFYRNEYFIKIIDTPKDMHAKRQYLPYPWVSAIQGTNFCHIGLDYDEKRNRIVVFSALDTIGKGGPHAAVQNMNLMFGLDETAGLKRYGLHPY